jgi:hypothetical protein
MERYLALMWVVLGICDGSAFEETVKKFENDPSDLTAWEMAKNKKRTTVDCGTGNDEMSRGLY